MTYGPILWVLTLLLLGRVIGQLIVFFYAPKFLPPMEQWQIDVVPNPSRLTRRGVVFAEGRTRDFDVIVAATGFTSGLDRLLDAPGALDERAFPVCAKGGRGTLAGLFFIGFNETPRGALFEANRDARHLARHVDRYLREGSRAL